jgi:hypothetical protein
MPRRAKIIPFPGPLTAGSRNAETATTAGNELVEVRRCTHAEALVVRSLLESHGIPVMLRSRIAHSVHPFTVGTQGEIVLLVPESHAPRSLRLLGWVAPLRVVRTV